MVHEVKGLKSCQKAVSVCTVMADDDVAVIVVYKEGPGVNMSICVLWSRKVILPCLN